MVRLRILLLLLQMGMIVMTMLSVRARKHNSVCSGRMGGVVSRPIPIVLVKCWKVANWNAKKLLKNCQKSKKWLPKFQKLLPKFLAIFI